MKVPANFPKSVKIGAMNYSISYPTQIVNRVGEYDAKFYLGWYSRDKTTIEVKVVQSRPRMAETLVHEILHGCFYEASLYDVPGVSDREEVIIDRLSKSLVQVIHANPGLMNKIESILAEKP